MKRLRWITAALATPLLMAGQALADFSYSTTITPTTANFGGSTLTFGNEVGAALNGPTLGLKLATVTDTTVTPGPPPATDTATISFKDVITIVEPSLVGPGMGMITVFGQIVVTRSDLGGEVAVFQFDPMNPSTLSTMIGTTKYTLSDIVLPQTTIGQSATLGGLLTVSVPEPSSLAALCVGGLLFAAPRLRRLVRGIARSEQG